MRLKNRILFFLGLLIPTLFVFRAFFVSGPVVWGDAPYFYPQRLSELVSEPYLWTSWGNNFGGINQFLWIQPIILLYGLFHTLFGFSNDLIIRVIFYFPAVLLAIISPIIFVRYLRYGGLVQFFASLLYTLNTYFLLLIDGGQVGVALAYGIFPLTILFLHKFVDKVGLVSFFKALVFLVLLTIVDPRFATISIITCVLWIVLEGFFERKLILVRNLRWLITLGVATFIVNAYWIVPTVQLNENFSSAISGPNFLSLLNSLFLFQPHWPENIFGKVSPPPFYFVGIPLLIFGNLFFRRDRKVLLFTFYFLVFAFFAKGETSPLGGLYGWVVDNVPFGIAFRDSTKFFAPLLLFGGVLIGTSAQYLSSKLPRFSWVAVGLIYAYLLLLIHPALLGNLNGVLAPRGLANDFKIIHEKLAGESGSFRAAWFPERHPFGFHSENKSAVDARNLVIERPLAALNVGNDPFNFINRQEFIDWFNLLGIKYLIFSGDPRKITWNQSERKDWDNLLGLTATASGLLKQDLGTSFPVYGLPDVKPKIFTTDKLIAVIGGDDIYQKIQENYRNFSVGNQAFVFIEDGKFNPHRLAEIPSDVISLVFNDKEEIDLTMSLLADYFKSPKEAIRNQWAVYDTRNFLEWKYQLLVRGVKTEEFDYGKGLAFSTVKNEVISFNFNVPGDGDYIFAVRALSPNGKFKWETEKLSLKKGEFKKEFINESSLQVINTVALIPGPVWNNAWVKAQEFTTRFPVIRLDGVNDRAELTIFSKSNWQTLEYSQVNPTRYKIIPPKEARWIVFTDTYHRGWQLKNSGEIFPSLPFYSMINGFYNKNTKDVEIVFQGQESVRWGFYWSAVSILLLAVIFLFVYAKRNRTK